MCFFWITSASFLFFLKSILCQRCSFWEPFRTPIGAQVAPQIGPVASKCCLLRFCLSAFLLGGIWGSPSLNLEFFSYYFHCFGYNCGSMLAPPCVLCLQMSYLFWDKSRACQLPDLDIHVRPVADFFHTLFKSFSLHVFPCIYLLMEVVGGL